LEVDVIICKAVRDVIEDDFGGKITVRMSARIRVYPADGFLPSADAVKTASAQTRKSVRADMSASARTHLPPFPSPSLPSTVRADAKFLIFFLNSFFLVGVACLEREKKFTIYNLQFTIYNLQFTIYGFRFSIPKIPELPELRGLRGRSREKKKVFSA
jgi:hypothetical protein